jgi:hypothetical protein
MQILFRKSLAEENEFQEASHYFNVIESRCHTVNGDLIIPRYSALPFYKELENDTRILRGKLINTSEQFDFIANLQNWYYLLSDLTPRTWFSLADVMQSDREIRFSNPNCQYVLKGETNSRKFLWDSHMYAKDIGKVKEIYFKLQEDSLISDQNICIREFEKFITYDYGINGLPIIKEFRFFVLNQQLVTGDYYWSNFPEVKEKYKFDANEVPKDFLKEIIERIGKGNNFYSIDVAQREDGLWRVVELNSGEMSGLSDINPQIFYKKMRDILYER